MIDDNTDHKNLIKKMNHNPKAYFMVNPTSHYANAMSIYTAFKRALDAKYYGAGVKKKNQKNYAGETPGEEPEKVNFRGTPFHKCEIPYDVFHMHRRTKHTIK